MDFAKSQLMFIIILFGFYWVGQVSHHPIGDCQAVWTIMCWHQNKPFCCFVSKIEFWKLQILFYLTYAPFKGAMCKNFEYLLTEYDIDNHVFRGV